LLWHSRSPLRRQAGGIFADFDGVRTATGRGAVVANPALHAEVLARLQASASSRT
jgi:hypothetical protein